jgi:hypothetical protein
MHFRLPFGERLCVCLVTNKYLIQTSRAVFAPDVDPDIFPPYAILPSPHHTVIEGLWRWLKVKSGLNIKDIVLRGKEDRVFNGDVPLHKLVTSRLLYVIDMLIEQSQRELFNWIFPPLVQAELEGFRNWWNYHHIRRQADKTMPSGHVPIDALEHPNLYAGLNCLIPVSPEAIHNLREYLEEDVGPRSSHLDWVSQDFAALAAEAHRSIGAPIITFTNAWEVFAQMSQVIGYI